jgi:hypothetical protein
VKKVVQYLACWASYVWAAGITGAVMAGVAIPLNPETVEAKAMAAAWTGLAVACGVASIIALPVAIVSVAVEYFMGWREPRE